jgi:hypothetical protein
MGDFYGAKKKYLNSLTKTIYVNHRIRKLTLERLISINQRIGLAKESPEKTLISRYFIKQKYVQILLDTSSFPNTKILKMTMTLAKMLFNNLDSNDHFGLKVLKNGFDPNAPQANKNSMQPDIQYLEEVIMLESKEMNTQVKQKYLDDYTNDLHAQNKQNRMGTRISQQRIREMRKQTLVSLRHTIQKIQNIEGYQVHEIEGVKIMGPMKWIVVVLGPNHQAKDLKTLIGEIPVGRDGRGEFDCKDSKGNGAQEFKFKYDFNLIVVLITNGQSDVSKEVESSTEELNRLCRCTPEGYMI